MTATDGNTDRSEDAGGGENVFVWHIDRTRVSSWEIRDTSFVVRRVKVSQGLLLRRLSEEISIPEPIAISLG